MKKNQIMNKNSKFSKVLAVFALFFLFMTLTACGSDFEGYVDEDINYSSTAKGDGEEQSKKIGVAMPTKDLQRWVQDGENMEQALRDANFVVDLQYAGNDAALQNEQIKGMIESGCEVLIIASVDGSALKESMDMAKEAGVQVIAYDRLIMNSDAVSYYATFDNQLVGKMQGEYIVDALDLENTKGPYTIELFTGSPDDNNCTFFFGGAKEVLQPYIDEGKLVVPSGQVTKEECSIKEWSTDLAEKRMKQILKVYYKKGKKLDAVLSSNDSVANGITNALVENYKGDFPVLTGQDCDINSVKNILAGKQSMSIFKDTRTLADTVVQMTEALLNGEEVPVNDTSSYDNGTGIIPSYLCEPVFADAGNYEEILLDSGYYTHDQLN